jgi:hypothetical protein
MNFKSYLHACPVLFVVEMGKVVKQKKKTGGSTGGIRKRAPNFKWTPKAEDILFNGMKEYGDTAATKIFNYCKSQGLSKVTTHILTLLYSIV